MNLRSKFVGELLLFCFVDGEIEEGGSNDLFKVGMS